MKHHDASIAETSSEWKRFMKEKRLKRFMVEMEYIYEEMEKFHGRDP